MKLVVNGTVGDHPAGTTVADVVRALGRDPHASGIAVARNGDIVPRAEWAHVTLGDGDVVDVLTAMQGG